MQKVALVFHAENQKAAAFAPSLTEWLEKRGVSVTQVHSAQAEAITTQTELVVCLGGDGLILQIARSVKENSAPIVGVNFGKFGFLAEIKEEEIFDELKQIVSGHALIEERTLLTATFRSSNGKTRRFQALNDMVVSREGLTRMLRLEIEVNGELFSNFYGDGVIVSTATGSTAYSLSSDGPLIYPTLDSLMITPICAHTLSLRPIVLSKDDKIKITLAPDKKEDRALLVIDGQENQELKSQDVVEVAKSNVKLKLIRSSKRNYFTILREKFKLSV